MSQREFTKFDIDRLTELDKLGYYEDKSNIFVILEFIKLDKWHFDKLTKIQQFKSTIQHIEYCIKEYKNKTNPRIRIHKDTFNTLTKNKNQLIKELINQKMLIVDGNFYELNTKTVYCRICAKQNQQENHLRNSNDYDIRQELREYEIKDHLMHYHYFYKTEYSPDYSKQWQISTVTQKEIDENITDIKPIYEFSNHKFEVTELSTNKDDLTIKVKCVICGYEPYINTSRLSYLCENKEID